MQDKAMRYLNGDFDYESGSLIFSCTKIEMVLKEGEDAQGIFSIEEQSGKRIQGSIYSSLPRMKCNQSSFEGENIDIDYHFSTQGMSAGEVEKGEIYIVSDMGEYTLPFVVTIMHETIESSLGSIKNLFHFTNLAKSNWEEAVKVFYSESFQEILTGSDAAYKNLYLGLCKQGNKNKNLEEFLIGIHKKQKIEYVPERSAFKLENPEDTVSEVLRIDRNGWGHTEVSVTCDGQFLSLEKDRLTDNDFLGSSCHFTFYIHEENLHPGKNYGRLLFRDTYGSFIVTVTVEKNEGRHKNLTAHKEKSMTFSIVRYYLDFRMKHISQSKWLLLTQEVLDHRKKMETDGVTTALFEAQLLITQERYNEAKWILDHELGNPELLNDTLYCYYLYLTSLYNLDEYYTRQAAERILNLYKKDLKNWRIGWLLLYLSKDLNKSASKKYAFAMELLLQGCYSPIIYLEIVTLLNAAPSLLMHLSQKEKQVLLFGVKEQLIGMELAEQITALALRMKDYDEEVYRILSLLYPKYEKEDTLQAICVLLMRGNKTGRQYFPWYEKAVMHNLPITRLYEYYMMSLDLQVETAIPKRVLMYFSYQSELNPPQNAYLYAYVVRNREKITELYNTYFPQMSRFVLKQLYAGRIDESLALLYQEIIMKQMFTPDNAMQLSTLLLLHCISVTDRDIVSVIVIDDRLKKEMRYPVISKKAYVSLVGSEYTLLLEDETGNRYYTTRDYTTQRFFLPRKMISVIEPYAKHSLPFDLFVCDGNRDFLALTEQNVRRYRYLEQSEEIAEDFRKAIRMHLIEYFFEQDDLLNLDESLEAVSPDDIMIKDRNALVRMLVNRRFFKKAFSFLLLYGADNIEAKTVGRIASGMLEENGMLESEKMTYVVYSAFSRGKYNEEMLQYLMRFYKGSSKKLQSIWKAAGNFCLDTYEICEKMIVQTLETGAFLGEEKTIFKQYVQGGAKTEIEMAYLSCLAYEYLVHERVTDEFMFLEMERLYQDDTEASTVCMLAYLKFFSTCSDTLSQNSMQTVQKFIHILYVKRHIIMPFFQVYRKISLEAMELSNMTMISYKGNPSSRVILHYVVNRENEEAAGFVREELKNMYAGIFVKPFLLFFGETLQYYITEEYDNKEQLTESGTIQKSDAITESMQDRYSMVNDIAIADTLKDYETAKSLLEEYASKKYLVENLFILQ